MCRFGGVLLAILLFAFVPSALAQSADEDEPDDIPQVGRPAGLPFSGASGNFAITTSADTETVQVEEPFTLLVKITATTPTRKPPLRPVLTELAAFRQNFFVEAVPGPASDVARVAGLVGLSSGWTVLGGLTPQTVWEFRYQLRPKNLDVTEIPAIPFVFYDPRVLSPERRFMTLYSEAIPLTVQQREEVQTAVQGPAEAFKFASGPELLARRQPWSLPGKGMLALILLAPPVAAIGWYLSWRRLYPNLASQVRKRRSRAASVALDLLRRLPAAPDQRARLVGSAVTRYLRLRLDLPFEEPTPRETADYLARHGCSLEVASEAMQFYAACAEARFQPTPPRDAAELPVWATRLILAVEGET